MSFLLRRNDKNTISKASNTVLIIIKALNLKTQKQKQLNKEGEIALLRASQLLAMT
jgi:hypothetical protein